MTSINILKIQRSSKEHILEIVNIVKTLYFKGKKIRAERERSNMPKVRWWVGTGWAWNPSYPSIIREGYLYANPSQLFVVDCLADGEIH